MATLRATLDTLAAEMAALRAAVEGTRSRRALEDYGDVLTTTDLAALVGCNPRFFERPRQIERQTGVRLLPVGIPGLPGRYTKDAVRAWLKTGMPQRATSAARALRSVSAYVEDTPNDQS